jgi:hypothetical protein
MLLMAFLRLLAFLLLLFLAVVGAIAVAGVSLSADVLVVTMALYLNSHALTDYYYQTNHFCLILD